MKHLISTLTGALLDAAVAKAQGGLTTRLRFTRTMLDERQRSVLDDAVCWLYDEVNGYAVKAFQPSTNWVDGGPIIERELLIVTPYPYENRCGMSVQWAAARDLYGMIAGYTSIGPGQDPKRYVGPTPLIAAMRAFVASKLGEEVELP